MPMVLTTASTGSYYHQRHHNHHHHHRHHHHPPEDLLPASWETLQHQQQQQQQQPPLPADRDHHHANKPPFPADQGQGAGQLTGSPLLDMGAGKLVTLIKKCLSRERDGAGSNNNTSSSSSSKHDKQDKPKSCRSGGPSSEQDRTRPSSSLGCYSLDSPPALGSSGFRPANSTFCDSPCNTRSKQGFSYPPSHSAMQQVVYVQQQQQQQQNELEVERLREHQRRLKSVEADTKLNYPTSVCRSKDGEEGYANSQRQLQFSNCNRDSMRNCIVPPPNRTLPQSESPLPNRSHSVGVLDRHSKLGSRTAPSLSPTAIPRCHTMSAATDNNNRLGNLNFNFTQGGGGGGGASHGTPRLGAPHGSNNPASLSLGVNTAATAGSGTRRTVRLTSSPAAIGRSRHTSSTSSYHSNTSNLSVGSASPAFDSPPEYASEV